MFIKKYVGSAFTQRCWEFYQKEKSTSPEPWRLKTVSDYLLQAVKRLIEKPTNLKIPTFIS